MFRAHVMRAADAASVAVGANVRLRGAVVIIVVVALRVLAEGQQLGVLLEPLLRRRGGGRVSLRFSLSAQRQSLGERGVDGLWLRSRNLVECSREPRRLCAPRQLQQRA